MTPYRRHDDVAPRIRVVVLCLLALLPVAFFGGRYVGLLRNATTVSAIESRPVPRELPAGIDRFHDAAEGVTCWRAWKFDSEGSGAVGVSCLPDQWLASTRQEAGR